MEGTATEVITGQDRIIEAIVRFQAGTKKIWCACVEKSLPAFSVGRVKQGYLAAKARGVKISYITEITAENLPYCREITEFAELRHIDGVRCNFALNETEYIAGTLQGETVVSLLRSDDAEIVRQQLLIFQTLWDNSEPASDRIARIR